MKKRNGIVDSTSHSLIQLMNFKKEDEIIVLLTNNCIKLEECKNVLYYSEILWLFEKLKNYFIKRSNIILEEEFYFLDAISGIFEGRMKDIVIYYLFVYANSNEDEKIEYILKKYDFSKSALISNQRFEMTSILRKGKIVDFIEKCKIMEILLINSKNWKQLCSMYISMIAIFFELKDENAYIYLKGLKCILKEIQLNANEKYMVYINLGSILLYANKYVPSISYLKKAIKLSNMKLIRNTVCICHAYRMIRLKIPSNYLAYDDLTKGDYIDWCMYSFYCNYDEGNVEEQKRYLVKKVLTNLKINDKLYLKIVKEELELLCENGKGYKAIYEYHDYIEKKQ